MSIDPKLKQYIDNNVLPQYSNDNSGHGIQHIRYVIRRCLNFSKQIPDININVIYTAAAYHDIAHHIDKHTHEILSAKAFIDDNNVKHFFNSDEIILIKEAIEDHRASANHIPRSIYGKILSTADRSTDVDEFLRRTHAYTLKHFPNSTEEEILERAITHTKEKYGADGYAKHYLPDPEYDEFISEIQLLLSDESAFFERYNRLNIGN